MPSVATSLWHSLIKLSDGRMRHIAFVKDPDTYWVEIISWNDVAKTKDVTTTDVSTYKMVSPRFSPVAMVRLMTADTHTHTIRTTP